MSDIIYSKFSNERAREFAIKTEILEQNGNRCAKKSALYEEGKKHIANIFKCYQGLAQIVLGTGYEVLPCEKEDDYVIFPYVEGVTLLEKVNDFVSSGDIESVKRLLKEHVDWIIESFSKEKFEKTDDFCDVFGDVSFECDIESDYKCAGFSNIDLVLDNIILCDDKKFFLDYEWTFTFPIPAKFIAYRALHYFVYRSEKVQWLLNGGIMNLLPMTEREKVIFDEMEENFQKYILGKHVPIREMYSRMGRESIVVLKELQHYVDKNNCQKAKIYLDYGQGITETHTMDVYAKRENDTYTLEAVITGDVKGIRIDPFEGYRCVIRVRQLLLDDVDETNTKFACSGEEVLGSTYIFQNADPWFMIEKNIKKIKMVYDVIVDVHDVFDGAEKLDSKTLGKKFVKTMMKK